MEVLRTDIVVIGGGLGACAAALAAARLGRRVILTEETRWVGGQLTNQAVPPDEHPWIEHHGATATYRALREGIRAFYRQHLPLTAKARATAALPTIWRWRRRLWATSGSSSPASTARGTRARRRGRSWSSGCRA